MPSFQLAAAPQQQTCDLREVRGFIARDARHGFHPAGKPLVWPALEELEGIQRRFFFEERVIRQQRQWLRQNVPAPGCRRARKQGQRVGFFENLGINGDTYLN